MVVRPQQHRSQSWLRRRVVVVRVSIMSASERLSRTNTLNLYFTSRHHHHQQPPAETANVKYYYHAHDRISFCCFGTKETEMTRQRKWFSWSTQYCSLWDWMVCLARLLLHTGAHIPHFLCLSLINRNFNSTLLQHLTFIIMKNSILQYKGKCLCVILSLS